jgi:hypothetical protein
MSLVRRGRQAVQTLPGLLTVRVRVVEEEDAAKMSAAAVTGVMQQQLSAELSVMLPAPATVSSVDVAKARVAEAAPLTAWVSAKRPSKWFGHT